MAKPMEVHIGTSYRKAGDTNILNNEVLLQALPYKGTHIKIHRNATPLR